MATDFRIQTAFLSHPKTIELRASHGADGVLWLIALWSWATDHRPDGRLHGISDTVLEVAVGAPDGFVEALRSIGFVDGDNGNMALHDWSEHQPWVIGSSDRTERARSAGKASWKARSSKGIERNPNGTFGSSDRTPSPSPSPNPRGLAERARAREEPSESEQTDLDLRIKAERLHPHDKRESHEEWLRLLSARDAAQSTDH